MTISFVLISSPELRKLIRNPASGDILVKDTVKCVSTVDVLLEIEYIKKRWRNRRILGIIREGKCQFHEAIHSGYVQTAMLDTYAVQTGLFETDEDFYDVDFWKPAIDEGMDPSYAVRIVSFRAYDMNFGTQFHLDV